MNKVSIRFYNDREVRAIWDEEKGQWYFSVLDVIGAINEQDDYTKTRNYWKYLKTRLKNEGSELVSVTHQLKLLAPDGKLRLYALVGLSARNNALKGQADHSPGQAKRHPGNHIGIINEQRPERAEA